MSYSLKFKYKDQRGWWNRCLLSEKRENAIKEAEEYIRNSEYIIEKAKVTKSIYSERTIKELKGKKEYE